MAFAPDGRLFICEQQGQIRIVKNNALLATPFLTLNNVDSLGERGILGIAFDPEFSTNHYVYVSYTVATSPAHNRISRFTAVGDLAEANSETIIFELNDQRIAAGLGGAINFGADGKLYTSAGTNEFVTSNDAQALTNFWGKMLRINSDGSIPSDNPFYNDDNVIGLNKAIWALGLRVPFTFSVQPGTGRMFINDVGEQAWEEINEAEAGANYGWPNCEGSCIPPNANFRDPVHSYPNDASTCAITGGTFYNPATIHFPSEYVGTYFFADFCGHWIRRLDPITNVVSDFATLQDGKLPMDLQVGPDGSLYYLARGDGAVYRIHYTASGLPEGFTRTQVATGLTQTIAMAFSPDGRLFVCEKAGRLRVVADGQLLETPFLTLDVETVGSNGSNGLLGVVFDPQFVTNNYLYVHYTVKAQDGTPAHNRVSRFTANGDTADPGSERVLLELHEISTTGHYGGDMHFGPDGKLYVAVGQHDSPNNAQSLTDFRGKILRLNPNPDDPIPGDNPFNTQAAGNNRAIWSLGLRNPFTFAFDPVTGRMFINDIGENANEEINDGVAGANYGWPETEGPTSTPNHTGPFYFYGRDQGCALTAGTFYNPTVRQFPTHYWGKYFFADWCQGWINTLDPAISNSVTGFAVDTSFPMDLEIGPDGSLYYIEWGGGNVFRIQYIPN